MIRSFARPYARAMMQLAGTPASARDLHAQLEQFERSRAGSRDLQDLFENPAVDSGNKMAIMREMASRLGVSDLGVRLLEVLVSNHRINDLGAVLDAWKASINASLGIAVAEVSTAHPLDRGEEESLRKALEGRLGRSVELRLSTDPSLLAGFVARMESEVWDASVRGKLMKFKEALS